MDCINLKVYSLPQTQFNSRKRLTISSISASLPQSGLSDQFRYVKNSYVAAVGEMIGDGVKLELTVTAISGLYACISIPKVLLTYSGNGVFFVLCDNEMLCLRIVGTNNGLIA